MLAVSELRMGSRPASWFPVGPRQLSNSDCSGVSVSIRSPLCGQLSLRISELARSMPSDSLFNSMA